MMPQYIVKKLQGFLQWLDHMVSYSEVEEEDVV